VGGGRVYSLLSKESNQTAQSQITFSLSNSLSLFLFALLLLYYEQKAGESRERSKNRAGSEENSSRNSRV